MPNMIRELENYTSLSEGMRIKSAEIIDAETRILASHYLCLVVENADGQERRVMFPVAKMVEARPYTKAIIELCDSGSEFFNIHEIAARQRGEPLLYKSDNNDETDNTD